MNESIRELMDCCRPQGDDLCQPEMQPLADVVADDADVSRQLDRSRQLDKTIIDAVHEVPIPVGLEQRLLAAVAESSAKVGEQAHADTESPVPTDVNILTPRSVSRRRRLWAVAATCAAALVVMPFVMTWQQPADDVGAQELASAAFTWQPSEENWITGTEIWTAHPLPSELRVTWIKSRQKVRISRYRVNASCYDLQTPSRTSARIYVFASRPEFRLPAAPPRVPASTMGRSVAAWSNRGLVYVLVIDGGENAYQALIRRPAFAGIKPRPDAMVCPIRTV